MQVLGQEKGRRNACLQHCEQSRHRRHKPFKSARVHDCYRGVLRWALGHVRVETRLLYRREPQLVVRIIAEVCRLSRHAVGMRLCRGRSRSKAMTVGKC